VGKLKVTFDHSINTFSISLMNSIGQYHVSRLSDSIVLKLCKKISMTDWTRMQIESTFDLHNRVFYAVVSTHIEIPVNRLWQRAHVCLSK